MTEVVSVLLKNEMDQVVSYQKAIKLMDVLEQPLQAQTTFATAVMEVCREVIRRTNNGMLLIGFTSETKSELTALVNFPSDTNRESLEESLLLARRLMPSLTISQNESKWNVKFAVSLTKQADMTRANIQRLTTFFKDERRCSDDRTGQHQSTQRTRVLDDDTSDFLSVATHELKTPLSIIKAYAELAMSENNLDELRMYLGKIDKQCDKLNDVIRQLVFAANEDYEMKIVEIGSFVKEILPKLQSQCPVPQLEVSFGKQANVLIDKNKMGQVLATVVANTAKFVSGAIGIMIDSGSEENDIVIISIYELESSLTKENLTTAFENKFYRNQEAQPSYTRSGLGLYLAGKIINDHGGIIWVESNDGGTAFHLSIPQAGVAELNNVL